MIEIEVLPGVGGRLALYINGYRVSGPKPLVNCKELASWKVPLDEVMTALDKGK